jgi:hypothetical protein
MREGLAREFPEAVRAIDWLRGRARERGPVLSTESVVWATISGIGAGFLVASMAQALVGLAGEVVQALRAPMPLALFPVVAISGTAAAAAVALTAGGLVALALDIAYVALGIVLGIPGRIFFCERSGGVFPGPGPDQCTAFGFVASLWPQLIGLGLGIALARALTVRGHGINSLLRVAGALATAVFVVSHVWAATVARAGYVVEPTDATTSGLTIAAGMAAAAVAAGVIAAQVPHGIRSAAIVALIWLLPWSTSQVLYASRSLTGPIAAENVAPIVISFVIQPLAAMFLVLSAAVAARSRFIPRDTA